MQVVQISTLHDTHRLETWGPLFTIGFALISYFIHRIKTADHQMSGRETLINIANFVMWRFLFFAGGIALQLWIFTQVATWIPWKLPHTIAMQIAAVVVADFFYYWRHRYEHEWSVLWAEHHVHHSSEEFNVSTSLRLPWIASYVNWPFLLPALLFGFSAAQIILGYQIILAYQYLVHTEFVNRLGPLEKLLNTPSHHRVHHGRNEIYLDRNYGGVLIVWDKLFGTFRAETITADFGTTERPQINNPIALNVMPWIALWAKVEQRPTLKGRMRALLLKPGEL